MSQFEDAHVHDVYRAIADDFSRTRHSPWPFVAHFLKGLPAFSTVLDAGTGNGKYLGVRSVLGGEAEKVEEPLLIVGLDYSQELLQIAAQRKHEAVRANCIALSCFRPQAFDHAISIATIHHFATHERRVQAVRELIRVVAGGERPSYILITVWAVEHNPALAGEGSARKHKKGSVPVPESDLREGGMGPHIDEGHATETSVKESNATKISATDTHTDSEKSVTLRDIPVRSGTSIHHVDELQLGIQDDTQDVYVKWRLQGKKDMTKGASYERYYHLFKYGELTQLVEEACRVLGLSFVGVVDEKDIEPVERHRRRECVVGLSQGEFWERENWAVKIIVFWRP